MRTARVRPLAALLAGHLLAAFVGGLVLAAVLMRDPFWQGPTAIETLTLAAGLSLSVLILAAPGWLVLRLAVIRPLLRRQWRWAPVLALFMGCQALNAVGALLALVAVNGGRLGSNAGQALVGVLLFLGAGAAAGAAAWVGERLVAGPHPPGRAVV